MQTKRIIAMFLVAAVAVFSVVGCGTPKEETNESSNGKSSVQESSPVDVSTTKIQVMDFDKKLDLKKPIEPIPKEPTVLLLGNSFLFANDMPGMFQALSENGGFKAEVFEFSDGGYHLSYFADPEDELGAQAIDALTEYDWDYVVMQEQSRLPTQSDMVEEEMIPAVEALNKLIKEANAQAVMMMTWAYKNGDDLTEFDIDKVTTCEEMQTELANSYIDVSQKIDSLLSPAGIAFIRSAKANPDIELWDEEDDMHPTVAGTYLAACTLYATLYNQSPVGLTFLPEGMTADTAASLQATAAGVVLS